MVCYHGSKLRNYLKMHKILDFIRSIFRGKTLRRIVFNWRLQEWCRDFHGVILDLGAGSIQSYRKWLPKDAELIATDIEEKDGVQIVDLNKSLPFADNSIDVATLFFALYILEDSKETLKEIKRVLKLGGRLYLSTPLIAAEIPEPHDYCRLTHEGLEKLFTEAGFSKYQIERIGGRASSAVIILDPLFVFNIVRLFVFPLCLFIDKITQKLDVHHPVPHSYFCVLEK